MQVSDESLEFEWDEGNKQKSFVKHKVSNAEAEEVFQNLPLILEDEKHSAIERRYAALGITNKNRKLFVIFTKRKNKIRIISSRDMNYKERNFFDENK